MRVLRSRLAMVCTLAVGLGAAAHAQFIDAKLDYRVTTVGKIRQVITNMGTFDKGRTRFPGLINAEFPPGSDEEHLFQGGIYGGITPTGDTLVSMSEAHFTPHEFYATKNNWNSIWTGFGKGDTLHIPYWRNYECISDQDFVSRYSDDNVLNIDNHTPLHLDIIQSTYSWSSGQLAEFLLHKYHIINKKQPLKDVYIGFWMHSSIGNIGAADNYIDEYTRYYRDYKMAVAEDSPGGSDGGAVSPIAFSVMAPNNAPTYSFNYYEHEELPVLRVIRRWRVPGSCRTASSGGADHPRVRTVSGGRRRDTEGGHGRDLRRRSAGAVEECCVPDLPEEQELPRARPSPPKPVLRVSTTNHEVSLDWRPLSNATNPELYTDANRGDTVSKPFEGYRLYKSTKGPDGPWTLLAEYDVINDEGYNTGLQYTFQDKGLLNNIEYYYGLTAFSKSDKVINFPSQETETSLRMPQPWYREPHHLPRWVKWPRCRTRTGATSRTIRTDPPWERPQGNRPWWMEQDRRIQFINLPTQCQIKIYTLAGDLVATLDHHDATRGYEDWNLTSSIGQAISSGIYLFTVEDVSNAEGAGRQICDH